MKNSKAIAFMLFGFLICGSLSWPTERQGAQVAVALRSGPEKRGELVAVKKDFLVLSSRSFDTVSDQSIPVADVRAVTIILPSKAGSGALIGLLAGAGGGAAVGLALGNDPPGFFSLTAGEKAGALGVVFGLLGAAVGGIAGLAKGADIPYVLDNKPETVVRESLGLLSRSARIQGIQ